MVCKYSQELKPQHSRQAVLNYVFVHREWLNEWMKAGAGASLCHVQHEPCDVAQQPVHEEVIE